MGNEVSTNRQIPDRWIKNGHDYILHLGTMRRAAVIRRFVPSMSNVWDGKNSWYALSDGGCYFPFTDEQKEVRFDNPYDAIAHAEKIILDWLNSITIGFNRNDARGQAEKVTSGQNLLEE